MIVLSKHCHSPSNLLCSWSPPQSHRSLRLRSSPSSALSFASTREKHPSLEAAHPTKQPSTMAPTLTSRTPVPLEVPRSHFSFIPLFPSRPSVQCFDPSLSVNLAQCDPEDVVGCGGLCEWSWLSVPEDRSAGDWYNRWVSCRVRRFFATDVNDHWHNSRHAQIVSLRKFKWLSVGDRMVYISIDVHRFVPLPVRTKSVPHAEQINSIDHPFTPATGMQETRGSPPRSSFPPSENSVALSSVQELCPLAIPNHCLSCRTSTSTSQGARLTEALAPSIWWRFWGFGGWRTRSISRWRCWRGVSSWYVVARLFPFLGRLDGPINHVPWIAMSVPRPRCGQHCNQRHVHAQRGHLSPTQEAFPWGPYYAHLFELFHEVRFPRGLESRYELILFDVF